MILFLCSILTRIYIHTVVYVRVTISDLGIIIIFCLRFFLDRWFIAFVRSFVLPSSRFCFFVQFWNRILYMFLGYKIWLIGWLFMPFVFIFPLLLLVFPAFDLPIFPDLAFNLHNNPLYMLCCHHTLQLHDIIIGFCSFPTKLRELQLLIRCHNYASTH